MIHARRIMSVVFPLLFSYAAFAQRVMILDSGRMVSFRGLSVVSEKIIWVSGSKGTVGISTNSGKTWRYFMVPGHEGLDFRDIEAFDDRTAVIMASGDSAIILKTTNAGASWKIVYESQTKGMFLDAMAFRNEHDGVVIGDPIHGNFFMAFTSNGGSSWKEVAPGQSPTAETGEACFAASGTNIRFFDDNHMGFVSGGASSRLFLNDRPIALPFIRQGKETQGANSLAVWASGNEPPHIIAVGGDFNADSLRTGNCALSRDGGKTWIRPSNPPYGYRSCVEFISSNKLITCGITGVDLSFDEGINWNNISATGFHVCRKTKKGDAVFLAGEKGRIGKIQW